MAEAGLSDTKRPFRIIRETDDPIALRASIGGRPEIGWYLVFRGEPSAIASMLEEVVDVARVELAKIAKARPQG